MIEFESATDYRIRSRSPTTSHSSHTNVPTWRRSTNPSKIEREEQNHPKNCSLCRNPGMASRSWPPCESSYCSDGSTWVHVPGKIKRPTGSGTCEHKRKSDHPIRSKQAPGKISPTGFERCYPKSAGGKISPTGSGRFKHKSVPGNQSPTGSGTTKHRLVIHRPKLLLANLGKRAQLGMLRNFY